MPTPEDGELTAHSKSNRADSEAHSMATLRVLKLLEDLKSTSAGSILYQHVARMLEEIEEEHSERDELLRYWVRALLDVYAKHIKPGTSTHVHVKLLQKQLHLPHNSQELKRLNKHIDMYALHIARMDLIDEAVLRRTLEPILAYYGDESDPLNHRTEPEQERRQSGQSATQAVRGEESQRQVIQDLIEELLPHSSRDTEQKLASKYRKYLNSQHRQAEKVQIKLMQHIQETIDENKQFGDMLESVMLGLNEAEEIDDINLLRQSLIEDVGKLGVAYRGLLAKLDEAKGYLKMIETDSRQLSDELARVRLLSMTDELTDLPNRRAFMRRLEDEMGRSQRYGFNLAMAMIDLDYFKEVNDRYGHAVGDAILNCYAEKILSVFRHHDLVARYGGEEFAVILPNTDVDGALAALQKVQRVAADTICQCGDLNVQAPTFSAGIAVLHPSDDVADFIKRADDAMYDAKRQGRDCIVLNHEDQNRLGKPDPFPANGLLI